MNLFQNLFRTTDDRVAAFLRIVLGIVILPHGLQKLLGVFGGLGLKATLAYYASLGMPPYFGLVAIAAETAGAICLLFGFLTRIAALGVAGVFMVAAITVHIKYGFFMNWGGAQRGEGVEYFLLGIAIAVAVMAKGGGAGSVDANIARPQPIDYSMMGR